MFTGVVPFRGTQQFSVYKDIKNRNIGWPEPEILEKIMSPEAKELIDLMIQVEPTQRLGHNLESIAVMKSHPFFKGIDFAKVSSKGFKDLSGLLAPHLPQTVGSMSQVEEFVPNLTQDIVIQGKLIKKNRFWQKQLRFF